MFHEETFWKIISFFCYIFSCKTSWKICLAFFDFSSMFYNGTLTNAPSVMGFDQAWTRWVWIWQGVQVALSVSTTVRLQWFNDSVTHTEFCTIAPLAAERWTLYLWFYYNDNTALPILNEAPGEELLNIHLAIPGFCLCRDAYLSVRLLSGYCN